MSSYAMVTGASSGLGLAMAEALARQGRNLLLVARQRDPLEAIALELIQRFDVEVLFRACDLGEPLRLSGFLLELEENQTRIDLLVNTAGVRSHGHFLAQEWSDEQDLIELNVLAMTRLCHALGNVMAIQGGGQILNVASIGAYQPGPWMATYCASKAYVLHFSEALREELKQTGVKVSVLCPGAIRSPRRPIKHLHNSTWCLSPEEVALHTVRSLLKNRAVIIPGRRNRWLARAHRWGSRWLVRKIAGALNKRYAPHLPQ